MITAVALRRGNLVGTSNQPPSYPGPEDQPTYPPTTGGQPPPPSYPVSGGPGGQPSYGGPSGYESQPSKSGNTLSIIAIVAGFVIALLVLSSTN